MIFSRRVLPHVSPNRISDSCNQDLAASVVQRHLFPHSRPRTRPSVHRTSHTQNISSPHARSRCCVQVPAGWASLDGGHAIMFIVHCVAGMDDQPLPQYTFTVCNTGEGVNYHAAIGHNIGERDRMSAYKSHLPHHRNALTHAHDICLQGT